MENPLASMPMDLHLFRCSTSSLLLDKDLGFWVKPRSTTWFSQFLLGEYNDTHWLEMFRMLQRSVFVFAKVLVPRISQHDTSLPSVVGAIDNTHISIAKPRLVPFDYYYFKSRNYILNCQAVVDSDKKFFDLYFGMPGFTNDSRLLKRSSLYGLATHNQLFTNQAGADGFSTYLLSDQRYPLLPWLMVLHRQNVQLSLAKSLFNSKLQKCRCVVENAFGILTQTFNELLTKSDLNVAFLPDVILSCAILLNILLGQSEQDVNNLFQVLKQESFNGEVIGENVGDVDATQTADAVDPIPENAATVAAMVKRRLLGLQLSGQRPQMR